MAFTIYQPWPWPQAPRGADKPPPNAVVPGRGMEEAPVSYHPSISFLHLMICDVNIGWYLVSTLNRLVFFNRLHAMPCLTCLYHICIIYIYIYIYYRIYIYIYIYYRIYIYIYIYIYSMTIHIYLIFNYHTYTHIYIYTYIFNDHIYIYNIFNDHIYIYIYIYMYIYIYIFEYIYIFIQYMPLPYYLDMPLYMNWTFSTRGFSHLDDQIAVPFRAMARYQCRKQCEQTGRGAEQHLSVWTSWDSTWFNQLTSNKVW